MLANTPPISSQMALSVGEPVKKRDKLEPKELLALTPKIINRMPTTSSAIETGLFIAKSIERHPKSGYWVKPALTVFQKFLSHALPVRFHVTRRWPLADEPAKRSNHRNGLIKRGDDSIWGSRG